MFKVLCVDDEPVAMKYWWEALNDEGFEVVPCRTLSQAYAKCDEDEYVAFMIDRMMLLPSDEDDPIAQSSIDAGEIFYSHIRKNSINKQRPIIILTNWYDHEWAIRMENFDSRLRIISKIETPKSVAFVMNEMIRRFPL